MINISKRIETRSSSTREKFPKFYIFDGQIQKYSIKNQFIANEVIEVKVIKNKEDSSPRLEYIKGMLTNLKIGGKK